MATGASTLRLNPGEKRFQPKGFGVPPFLCLFWSSLPYSAFILGISEIETLSSRTLPAQLFRSKNQKSSISELLRHCRGVFADCLGEIFEKLDFQWADVIHQLRTSDVRDAFFSPRIGRDNKLAVN
jgi:hypothetical protein